MRFRWRGQAIEGAVAELQRSRAVVAAGDDALWKVPYTLLTVVERAPEQECTLAEVETLAGDLLARHRAASGLDADWGFGFDLSTARAGVCRYADKRIDLSVSYCLRATRADIEDTLLHEIAHAIVGHRHHHDDVWKAVARAIGCSAERCHDVDHTPARWLGECGCGKQWRRQRLSRRLRHGARCRKCGGEIAWRLNTGAEAPPSAATRPPSAS
ncbi:MAG: SprT-like domain-containing protein [Acidobacteria bacterium]|nr:SprT-like domain-containing protein [Acidobacteriota bacterium]